jgi:O-acetyl-ADP-ribose deacetylase (regulator of RNase III)
MTDGYLLTARKIIHTVGPIWHGGNHGEAELLASCYQQSLILADQHGLHSVAFPSISTGAYGFPVGLAAPIAIHTVREYKPSNQNLRDVIFCCFSSHDLQVYSRLLAAAPQG